MTASGTAAAGWETLEGETLLSGMCREQGEMCWLLFKETNMADFLVDYTLLLLLISSL